LLTVVPMTAFLSFTSVKPDTEVSGGS